MLFISSIALNEKKVWEGVCNYLKVRENFKSPENYASRYAIVNLIGPIDSEYAFYIINLPLD